MDGQTPEVGRRIGSFRGVWWFGRPAGNVHNLGHECGTRKDRLVANFSKVGRQTIDSTVLN